MLVDKTYKEITELVNEFINERLQDDLIPIHAIELSLRVSLSLTTLTDEEISTILIEVLSSLQLVINQRRICVEKYSATKVIINDISPY